MAQLPEHLSKQLLADCGVPIGRFTVVGSADSAEAAATAFDAPVMVKALVPVGGRGNAGAVVRANDPDEAAAAFRVVTSIMLEGMVATSALVEPFIPVDAEYYLAIVLNPVIPGPELLFSSSGGVDVEDAITLGRVALREDGTVPATEFNRMVGECGIATGTTAKLYQVAAAMARAYAMFDAVLVEVNPLGITDNRLRALDARVITDDNALFRQPRIAQMFQEMQPRRDEDIVKEDTRLDYLRLGGSIGLISGGAGLTMATMDAIDASGSTPGCFLDCSANPTKEGYARAFDLVLEDHSVQVVLVSIFGGLTRVDSVARNLVELIDAKQPLKPVVIRLMGTNVAGADEVLRDAGFTNHHELEDAILTAIDAIPASSFTSGSR